MIEVTVVEVLLFCWAIFATGAWFKAKDRIKADEFFIRVFLEDEGAREMILSDYKKFKQRRT